MQQQLDQLSTIGRCEYEKTCALLVQLFDQAAQTYQELLQSTNSSAMDITVQEGKSSSPASIFLSGLPERDAPLPPCRSAHVAGVHHRGRDRRAGVVCQHGRAGCHGRRVSLSVRERTCRVSVRGRFPESVMSRLCFCLRVLQLMNLTDSRLAQAGNERLELAMLSFFEQFRKIYIGDQVQKSSKVSSASSLQLVWLCVLCSETTSEGCRTDAVLLAAAAVQRSRL